MSVFEPESYTSAWLNCQPEISVPSSTNVPADRPDSFITVGRTGGGGDQHTETVTLAIQCWAPTRLKAAVLAEQVRGVMLGEFPFAPPVRSVTITGDSDFPLDERTPRAQLVFDIIFQP